MGVEGQSVQNGTRIPRLSNAAKGHGSVRHARRGYWHKLSTRLIRENHVVCVEDLALSIMVKNPNLACAGRQASWRELRAMAGCKPARPSRCLCRHDRWPARIAAPHMTATSMQRAVSWPQDSREFTPRMRRKVRHEASRQGASGREPVFARDWNIGSSGPEGPQCASRRVRLGVAPGSEPSAIEGVRAAEARALTRWCSGAQREAGLQSGARAPPGPRPQPDEIAGVGSPAYIIVARGAPLRTQGIEARK